jgi:hypothetical protein
MLGKSEHLVNRRRVGDVVENFGDGASWRGGMRLEAVIAAGWKPARRGEPTLALLFTVHLHASAVYLNP